MNKTFFALVILLLHPSWVFSLEVPGYSYQKVVHRENSLYQFIAVIEDEEKGERYIATREKGTYQGGIKISDPDSLLFEYTRMAFISLSFMDHEPEDVLFVGLGGGAMPRYLARFFPKARIDTVEIDPAIHNIARKYFHYEESGLMKTYIEDGRVHIKRTGKKYDMIFLDAYQAGTIPFHLTTREFLRETSRALKKNGVVVSNILANSSNKFYASMIATYEDVFRRLYMFKARKSQNYIFVSMDYDDTFTREKICSEAGEIQKRQGMDIDLANICWTTWYVHGDLGRVKILSDDFAPVNIYKYMRAD